MSLNLSEKVVQLLSENPGQRFTTREIAEWVFENFEQECQDKQGRTGIRKNDKAIITQIAGEITAARNRRYIQKKDSRIKTTEDSPIKFYFGEQEQQPEQTEGREDDNKLTEYELYAPLSQFLLEELNVYSKRIDEKRSSRSHTRGRDRWLHPDLVGMEDLSNEWGDRIKNCAREYSDLRARLWSFEVKRELAIGNVREAYFQAVSNSSWANVGYLVAAEITNSQQWDTKRELQILSGLHGVGVIKLNAENPLASRILVPASQRESVDWNIANRLTIQNQDFQSYIDQTIVFQKSGMNRKEYWDYRPEEEG